MTTHHSSRSGYSGSSKNILWVALMVTEGYPNIAPQTFIVFCGYKALVVTSPVR